MAAGEALTGVGELLFSLLIGYLGALEFAFVARHLYHWTCQHPSQNETVDAAADSEELPRLRERLDKELAEAAAREAAAGGNVMQDGILYSNGFRKDSPADKQAALAAELERQRRIEEETRKQLAEAEAKLAEERKKAEQEKLAAESAESERKLLEAEKQRAASQREREESERKVLEAQREERQENERKLLEAERQRVEQEQQERQENERKLIEAEKQREAAQREEENARKQQQRELEDNERKLQEAEEQRQEAERQRELATAEAERILLEVEEQLAKQDLQENERKLKKAEQQRIEAERQRELAEAEAERRLLKVDQDEQAQRDAEIVERLLAAERERKLSATESELEEEAIILEQSRRLNDSKANLEKKQRSIEENARLFMEAEEEMVMVQQRMLQAAAQREEEEYAGAIPVVEEPCIKKILPPRFEEPQIEEPLVVQRVKTQMSQTGSGVEPYMVKSKTLTFPGVSDEGSSVEPNSSQQSSFSTQPSEERTHMLTEEERQEPEGEDNVPDVQYTEDYLRSLDGIKNRPLVREDGSGRRRAFKKRRSSGSSNSSRESRASRDEELKMFTSLEEEELRHGEKADYNPIKYTTTEPTLRVKSHHRRHKRSPAKDMKPEADASGSLEMLGEESTNPWGEVVPEHYKNTEFWKREKALSIDEEELDLVKQASGEEVLDEAQNKPKASSFEEATDAQNELAASTLLQQLSKEQLDKDSTESSKATEASGSDIKSNLQTSSTTEEQPRLGSPGLRRSPRIDEIDHYEERWVESEAASHTTVSQPPSITVQQPDTAPWRDQYGLLMEGISDFYDFTASVNPSRSRSTSRNPSPQPKNVANRMDVDNEHTLEVYDDTQDGLLAGELNCESVLQMLETTMNGTESQGDQLQLQNVADDVKNGSNSNQVVPMVYETLDERCRSRTRSRSRSLSQPPHTISDLEQTIKQKDQLMEAMPSNDRSSPMDLETNGDSERNHLHLKSDIILPQPVIEINAMSDEQMENAEPIPTREEMRLFVETLRAERNSRSRTQSRSRSRSPLPTADNIARSLETRRLKRIKQNDELFEKLHDEEILRSSSTSPVPVPLGEENSRTPSTSPVPIPIIALEEKSEKPPASPLPVPMIALDEDNTGMASTSPLPMPMIDFDEQNSGQKPTSPVNVPTIALSPPPMPTISIEIADEPTKLLEEEPEPVDTPESMARLFEQLRLNRCRSHSRSRSRSPLPTASNLEHSLQKRREKLIAQNDAFFEQMQERALTPEPERRFTVEHRTEYIESDDIEPDDIEPDSRITEYIDSDDIETDSRDMRSLSPSRSRSRSRSLTRESDYEQEHANDFHVMLNLEGSENRTLRKTSEELETVLANKAKHRELDLEALHQLTTASEEIELRVLSPSDSDYQVDYERTMSEAARDLKDELLVSGFKRSTYVGESLDMGSEQFEQLRRDESKFQRSRSASPAIDMTVAREQAASQRELQAAILNSLVTSSGADNENRFGAKPKTSEYERTFSEEVKDTQRMKEETLAGGFKRSTYVGESVDLGIAKQLDDLRHRTAEFQRSRSQSRSPMRDDDAVHALKNVDAEAQDQLIDQQFAASSVHFHSFSKYLNADFLESERRASDSAILQLDPYAELEPEEYHHFRRYSLAQEQPVEEYPSDECVYISQIEVHSLTGKRTWLKEDFYTHDLASLDLSIDEGLELTEERSKNEYISEGSWARAVLAAEAEAAEFDATSAIYNFDILGQDYQGNDDVSTNDSDDERQTVVEIDDDEYEFELDEGISDNNERTQPTDESHHDISECEEAERNTDRYANRDANDWEEVDNVQDFADYNIDDGAVGGVYSDPDSYIEQIYNDAVKNRKQSGILREYETMIQEQLPAEYESDKDKSSSDSERYALWAKSRELDRSEHSSRHRDIDISLGLLESERRDSEMRYLGDAQGAARQSTRLRTRYGYSPKLQAGLVEDDIEVDLNYKPKHEYNWRKNFKLDDQETQEGELNTEANLAEDQRQIEDEEEDQVQDMEEDEIQLHKKAEDEIQLHINEEDEIQLHINEEEEFQSEMMEENQNQEHVQAIEENQDHNHDQFDTDPSAGQVDLRRFSLGGESITLFSRSPERGALSDVPEEMLPEPENGDEAQLAAAAEPTEEKPKKKKSKKKSRKGSKTEEELCDDNDSDNQQYNRRNSKDDVDTPTDAPKRKVRSRRSSKSSTNNEEGINGGLFSPRHSVGFVGDALEGIAEFEAPDESSPKKKTKKRKKAAKETKEQSQNPQTEDQDMDEALAAALAKIAPISISASTNLTPESTQQNLLSSISSGASLCLTPASSFEEPLSPSLANNNNVPTVTTVVPARSVVDTFDILKDANFYPLF